MKKRVISFLLCAAMVASLVVGCGAKQEETDTSVKTEDVAVEEVTEGNVFVSADWLTSAIAGEVEGYEDVVVCEVGYGMDPSDAYNDGHIPGAIYVANVEVEDATGDEKGAYNLLSFDEVAGYLAGHGITKDTKVVLYGDDITGVGRQAYGYLWAGVEDVKVLNGGRAAWTGDTEADVNTLDAADAFGLDAPAHPEYWVSIEDAKDRVANDDTFKLVSIRAEAEWLGETSGYNYMDKAGEPEGAVWGQGCDTAFDVAQLVHEDGTVLTINELKDYYADADFDMEKDTLAFYCGTGWRATVPFLIMKDAGYENMTVYDGGWYEWIMHDDYPVQVGDPASDSCEHTTVGELPNDKAAK